MDAKRIAALRGVVETYGVRTRSGAAVIEALNEIERLQAKLGRTKDGVAVGLVDNVFHKEDNGIISSRTVWADGSSWKAYWGANGPPVPVGECYDIREAAEAGAE